MSHTTIPVLLATLEFRPCLPYQLLPCLVAGRVAGCFDGVPVRGVGDGRVAGRVDGAGRVAGDGRWVDGAGRVTGRWVGCGLGAGRVDGLPGRTAGLGRVPGLDGLVPGRAGRVALPAPGAGRDTGGRGAGLLRPGRSTGCFGCVLVKSDIPCLRISGRE